FQEILNAIKQASVYLITAAFLLSFVNIYLQFYKWKITANVVLQENQNSKIWLSLFYGFSAGVFTPARIGEYFGRALVFKNHSLLQVTLATLLDKFFLLLIVAFFGSISSILFINYYYHVTFYLTIGLFILVFALFYLFFWMIFNDRFWDNVFFSRLRDSIKLHWLFEKIKVFRNLNKKYATIMFLVSILFYICFLVQYALLVAAFSNHNQFWDYLWAGNLMMFAKTIIPPVSLGELGIREGASVFFITQLGESASTGFNASIFLFFINVLIPSLIGLTLLLKKNDD
ncbi:MAG: lysylphosphatidylglycerol synthase transmembrane domain-containing protein, partial [Ignavibacteria bacterium]|nr:lysylphosphatidylglycerol synthase transmembrane domain-containing protein [Ignavibacteria bacterium]